MTLKDLLERLRDAGLAMQRAALADAERHDGVAAPGTTTEFLSAPRNSLMLRWKPEAHSAIREAFAIFTSEMRTLHSYTRVRPIHAYELIEGNDMELSTLFATLCGIKMANSAHLLVVLRGASAPSPRPPTRSRCASRWRRCAGARASTCAGRRAWA